MSSDSSHSPVRAPRPRSPATHGSQMRETDDDSLADEESLATPNGRLSDDDGDGDLFGDDNEDDDAQRKRDDSDRDSEDDEGRQDRLADTVESGAIDSDDGEGAVHGDELQFMSLNAGRIKAPEVSDDGLYVLNLPPFLGLEPKNFDPSTYEPPTLPHDGNANPNSKFSPFSAASTSLFWRHDPQDPSKLQSNSRIVRWSDGSLTLQLASSPHDHYRLSTTALTQAYSHKTKTSKNSKDLPPYDPAKDSHIYLCAPHWSSNMLQFLFPFSAAIRILPTGTQTDESLSRLQSSLAAAAEAHDPFASIKRLTVDPERARVEAENAEKDVKRKKLMRENAEQRVLTQRNKVLGSRMGGRGDVGLTIGGLEDEDGMPMSRGPKKSGGKKKKRANRHGDIYSDDEDDDYPRGKTREDEYDLEDDFIEGSDVEPEVWESGKDGEGEEDPDVDDLEIEGRETLVAGKTRGEGRAGREGTPKRALDIDADESGMAGSPHAGRKKRRVVEDDDD